MDQLEIASRICSLVALSKTDDVIQFPVLDVNAVFEIHLVNSEVSVLKIISIHPKVSGEAALHRDVRVLGVGDFFVGRHVTFSAAVLARVL